jgi:hypothetical protein
MTNPTQGLSAGPLLLAVAALAAASASIGLAAGRSGSSERVTTSAGARGPATKDARSDATHYARVAGPVRTLAPAGDPSGNDVGSASASCPAGMRVISGGYQMTGGGETFYSNAPAGGRVGWAVGAVNNLSTTGTVQAFAYCVRSGRAAGNRRTLKRRRVAARRQMEALIGRYRARRALQL